MNTIPQTSVKTLVLACISSTLLAIVVLLVAVLPAEFNIDPTGLGKALGLTVLSQTNDAITKPVVISCPESVNTAVVEELESTEQVDDHVHQHNHQQGQQHTHTHPEQWQDTVMISIPPGKGLEYKFYIKKGEKLEFVWDTEGIPLYFDFHGEPEGDKTGYFKSFKESNQSQSSGTLLIPFTGNHGWYWENKSNQAAKIILKTRGHYKKLGLM
ncbi:MAG: hypothetical protein ACKE51_02880 [Methylococcaceae bacterium]